MTISQTFQNEAMELYRAIPEETNDLYKRRHITIDIEALLKQKSIMDNQDTISNFAQEIEQLTGIKFDLIISNNIVLLKQSKYISVVAKDDISFSTFLQMADGSVDDKYLALTLSQLDHILDIHIPSNQSADIKILLISISTSLPIKIITTIAQNSRLNMLELCASKTSHPTYMSLINQINAAANSNVEINIIHPQEERVTVINNTYASAEANASLKINYSYIGAGSIRSRNTINAKGAASNIHVNELVFGSKEQKLDINTNIINSGRDSISKLNSKVALMQNSLCFIKGFAKIINGAKESKSFVEETGMIIDRSARIDSIPSVSIDENAVKATHSSSTGPIDQESMFYMTSKGIDAKRAQKLIVSGFFSPIISDMNDITVKSMISSMISHKIKNNGAYGIVPKTDTTEVIWFTKPSTDIFERHYKYR